MGLFQEYMDSHGKVKKPKVDISGGDPDPKTPPTKPPKGGKPYAAEDGKSKKNKKGFGDQGDEDLIYQPSKDAKSKGHPPAKIPTVEQAALASATSDALVSNPEFVEKLVNETKKKGMLGPLLAEMLQHKATYNYMTEIMEHKDHGPEVCARLARAMNAEHKVAEEVAPPFPTAST